MPLLFVYGTLKRGGANHRQLDGQQFVAEARTVPGFALYQLDGYPGMVVDPADRNGITGEMWQVDAAALHRLDLFEGVPEGLYHRERLALQTPFEHGPVETYLFAGDIRHRPRLGDTWSEQP